MGTKLTTTTTFQPNSPVLMSLFSSSLHKIEVSVCVGLCTGISTDHFGVVFRSFFKRKPV